MSFFEVTKQCRKCNMRWKYFDGVVGSTFVSSPKDSLCPKCGKQGEDMPFEFITADEIESKGYNMREYAKVSERIYKKEMCGNEYITQERADEIEQMVWDELDRKRK